jgi:hypothetical protein
MSFCEHCEGQRFDRARALRALRAARKHLETSQPNCSADTAMALAIEAVRSLDIPHVEPLEDLLEGEIVH